MFVMWLWLIGCWLSRLQQTSGFIQSNSLFVSFPVWKITLDVYCLNRHGPVLQARTEWREFEDEKKRRKKRKPGRTIPWHTPCTTSNVLDWFKIICWEPLEVKHYDFKAWKENPTTTATGFRAQQRERSHSWVFERRLHFLFGQYKQLNGGKTQSSADFIREALSNQAILCQESLV